MDNFPVIFVKNDVKDPVLARKLIVSAQNKELYKDFLPTLEVLLMLIDKVDTRDNKDSKYWPECAQNLLLRTLNRSVFE